MQCVSYGTPKVSVYSNQGLVVRQLGYYRRTVGEATELRVSLQYYDNTGQITRSIDPRLSTSYLKDSSFVISNQEQCNMLSGAVLKSRNVDAGTRVVIFDCQNQALRSWDSRGAKRCFEYDELRRVKTVTEKVPGKAEICSERLCYGTIALAKENNGVGRLLERYDTAGCHLFSKYTLLGEPQEEEQRFLKAGEVVNWAETNEGNEKRLETVSYNSAKYYNALGKVVRQIDARSNVRSFVYNIIGQLEASYLQLKQGKRVTLISNCHYNANGQLQKKQLGNGVIQHYSYQAKTQRLSRLQAIRQKDNKLLQDLNYIYDPVGNVLSIEDKAKEVGFYSNEKTEAISRYRYDSFYQLIEASGIESQQAGKETSQLPGALFLGNMDANRCVNYTRSYQYDAGGNLYVMQHQSAKSYKYSLQIDVLSNRGIEESQSGLSLQQSFDGNGNLLYTNTGQFLEWDIKNQLQQVVQVQRGEQSDKEFYRYDGVGQRIEKITQRLSENQIHIDRVRYLPGLELREYWQTDLAGENRKVIESMAIIRVAGNVQVLSWQEGKPTALENNSLRYTLIDHLGSSQLELNDAAEIITYETYYPYGGTAIWSTRNQSEVKYKFIRYSGKERDATGFYYYGYRYYMPYLGRWLNADPSGIADGLNLFRMANNNPITFYDADGKQPVTRYKFSELYPDVVHDELRGFYRPIQRIHRQGKEVNVKVWDIKTQESGKLFYLVEGEWPEAFPGADIERRVHLFSHGGYTEATGEMELKSDMPTLHLSGPHGKSLYHSLAEHLTVPPYASISSAGITLVSQQAEKDYREYGYQRITGSKTKKMIPMYILGKKETLPSEENFQQGLRHNLEEVIDIVAQSRMLGSPFDIMATRGWSSLDVAILTAQAHNYESMLVSTCRRDIYLQPDIFERKSVVAFREPRSLSWEEMPLWQTIPLDLTI